ncbi:hypothetical protein AK812_SmicGene37534 [Symbiodinium microadriaticum]|uniref:RepB-like DNA primase domain-containing protein n=1 Tax=Symbiodinium microadriaticum TaxID=2951 RepID=A0A1Q9CG57_SYMMI|nr:hypothetical protein AK812_SmicGene37534 [Symbiodinium microadriaticum]
METALEFLGLFPEAHAWNVSILSTDKRAVVYRPSCSRDVLRQNLPTWLSLHNTHFFIRPLLRTLVFLDLDGFPSQHWEALVRLQPRAIVETSPGNLQAWFTLDTASSGPTAVYVTKELAKALGGDPGSTAMGQQGRMPGSINVKPGRANHKATLLLADLQCLNEKEFLAVTSAPKLAVVGGSVVTAPAKPGLKALKQDDHSAADWKAACNFFEGNPQATVADAKAALQGGAGAWGTTANKANQSLS